VGSRTIVEGDYEWDCDKALQNEHDHGVSFSEAATALAHPHCLVTDDGGGRGRLQGVGVSRLGRALTVVFEERGERDRIISARKATRQERRDYMRL
jgi:uncharacterized DUF497 family protein